MTEQNKYIGMLPVGYLLHGTYRIESYLASGGFGNTYVAKDIKFNDRVAVKEFFMKDRSKRGADRVTVSVSTPDNEAVFEEQRTKFEKEARRLRGLHNEHIVRVYDLFRENGTEYYVMDYIDGESLSARLRRFGHPFSENEVMDILRQMLDALSSMYSSEEPILHLDIKPDNIMIDRHGKIKLIDFGASKLINADTNTPQTAVLHSNRYSPLEQMSGDIKNFGPWTDFYALGATLYTLLCNDKPPMPTEILNDKSPDKRETLPFNKMVSARMQKLVLWMMAPVRADRPQTVSEIYAYINKKPEPVKKAEPVTRYQTARSANADATRLYSNPQRSYGDNPSTASRPVAKSNSASSASSSYSSSSDRSEKVDDRPFWKKAVEFIADLLEMFFVDTWLGRLIKWGLIIFVGLFILHFVVAVPVNYFSDENNQKEGFFAYLKKDIEEQADDFRGVEGVDLGLPSGTIWCNKNLGAEYQSDNGDAFALGAADAESESPKEQLKEGQNIIGTQYDAAHEGLGGGWQLPSEEQCKELARCCRFVLQEKGIKVVGPNGNSIYLPLPRDNNNMGEYWVGTVGKAMGLSRPTGVKLNEEFSEDPDWMVRGFPVMGEFFTFYIRPVKNKE